MQLKRVSLRRNGEGVLFSFSENIDSREWSKLTYFYDVSDAQNNFHSNYFLICRGMLYSPYKPSAFSTGLRLGRSQYLEYTWFSPSSFFKILACKLTASFMRHYMSTTITRSWWSHFHLYKCLCIMPHRHLKPYTFLILCSLSQACLSPPWWLWKTFLYTLDFNKHCSIRTSTLCDYWLII